MNTPQIFNLPVTLVIDRFSSKQLWEIGQQLQSLTSLPAITLLKQVSFFPAQFYGIPNSISFTLRYQHLTRRFDNLLFSGFFWRSKMYSFDSRRTFDKALYHLPFKIRISKLRISY